MAKKKGITKILSCFVIFVILMSVIPFSVLASNSSDDVMGVINVASAKPSAKLTPNKLDITVNQGDTFTVTFTAENKGSTPNDKGWSHITISVEKGLDIVDWKSWSSNDKNPQPEKDKIWHKNGYEFTAKEEMLEAYSSFPSGTSKEMKVTFKAKPDVSGKFLIKARFTLVDFTEDTNWETANYYRDPAPEVSTITDQQGHRVIPIKVHVKKPTKPSPKIIKVDCPSSITLWEKARIKVKVKNEGEEANWQTISISFPQNPKDIKVVNDDLDSTNVFWAGEEMWCGYGTKKCKLKYPVAEGSSSPWTAGEDEFMEVEVKPEKEGDFKFYVKSVAGRQPDGKCYSQDPKSGTKDQQEEYVKVYTINVLLSSLKVNVKNTEGYNLPSCGGQIEVVLYDKNWKHIETKSVNYAGGEPSVQLKFDNLANDKYFIEVYQTPNTGLKVSEFWGADEVTVSGSTTKDFIRHTQWIKDVKINGKSPYGNEIKVNPGEKVHVDITVKNDEGSSKKVKVRLMLDRDKSSNYDFDETHGPVNVQKNGYGYFGYDFSTSQAGTYYFYIITSGYYNDKYTVTDQHDWYKAFNAIEIIKGNGAWLYGKDASYITSIEQHNSVSNKDITYLFPYAGSLNLDNLDISHDTTVTSFYKSQLSNLNVYPMIDSAVNLAGNTWDGNVRPPLTQSQIEILASNIATKIDSDPNADGLHLDIEPYDESLISLVKEIRKSTNKPISVAIGKSDPPSELFDNCDFLVLMNYDLGTAPTPIEQYATSATLRANTFLSTAKSSNGYAMIGVPAIATNHEWEYKKSRTTGDITYSGYMMEEYLSAALDAKDTAISNFGESNYVGISVWAFLSSPGGTSDYEVYPYEISDDAWGILSGVPLSITIEDFGITPPTQSVPTNGPITAGINDNIRIWHSIKSTYTSNKDVKVITKIRNQDTGEIIPDPTNDKVVTLSPSDIWWYSRSFVIPSGTKAGTYDVLYSIYKPDQSDIYDETWKAGWLIVDTNSYTVSLRSSANDGSLNIGSIRVDTATYNLPSEVTKQYRMNEYYYVEAITPTGYNFDKWETFGGVIVSDLGNGYAKISVTGAGTLNAVFKKAPTFEIILDPSSILLNPGEKGSTLVNVKSLNGFSGSVELTLGWDEASGNWFSNVNFDPKIVTMTSGEQVISELSFDLSSSATPGVYNMHVGASDLQRQCQFKYENLQLSVKGTTTQDPVLENWEITPTMAKAGGTVELHYYIYNPNSQSLEVTLGATMRDSNDQLMEDGSNDIDVTVAPGRNWYTRSFVIDPNANTGYYDVMWGIHKAHLAGMYGKSGWQENRLKVVTFGELLDDLARAEEELYQSSISLINKNTKQVTCDYILFTKKFNVDLLDSAVSSVLTFGSAIAPGAAHIIMVGLSGGVATVGPLYDTNDALEAYTQCMNDETKYSQTIIKLRNGLPENNPQLYIKDQEKIRQIKNEHDDFVNYLGKYNVDVEDKSTLAIVVSEQTNSLNNLQHQFNDEIQQNSLDSYHSSLMQIVGAKTESDTWYGYLTFAGLGLACIAFTSGPQAVLSPLVCGAAAASFAFAGDVILDATENDLIMKFVLEEYNHYNEKSESILSEYENIILKAKNSLDNLESSPKGKIISLDLQNTEVGKSTTFWVKFSNIGTKDVQAKGYLDIYKDEKYQGTVTTESKTVGMDTTVDLEKIFTPKLSGVYAINAYVIYDGIKTDTLSTQISVAPVTGAIVVNTNNANAKFTIIGLQSFSGEGTSWSTNEAPIGTYKIIFDPIEGYDTPPSQELVLTPDSTITFTGDYIQQTITYSITLRSNRADIPLIVDGKVIYHDELPKTFTWSKNSEHTIKAQTEVNKDASTKYVFVKWDDGNTDSVGTITVKSDKTYNAEYKTQYCLSLKTNPENIGTVFGAGWYDVNSPAEITAPVITGYAFTCWTVDGATVVGNPIMISMDSPHNAVANYGSTDTTHPAVIGNTPTGSDVPVNTPIIISFSEAMNQESAQSAFYTSPATIGGFSWTGNTMAYTPGSNLVSDTTYTVTVGTGATDLTGNNLQSPYSWQFITASTEPKLCTSPDPPSPNFGTVDKDQTRTWDFYITNSGSGTLTWTITCDQPWIKVNPTGDSTTKEADVVTVTIDTHGLSPGTHTGHITLNSNGGSKTGTITVNVPTPPLEPKLCTSPDLPSPDFGTVPKDQTRTWDFFITNCGSGTLTWSVSCDQSWISVNPTSDSTTTEADVVTVTIDTHGLTPGTHTGHVTVTSNGGSKTGTITVNIQKEPEKLPDLQIHSMWIEPNPCKSTDDVGTNFDLKNAGDADVSAFDATLLFEGELLEVFEISEVVKPAESFPVSIRIKTPKEGEYMVCLDYSNRIKESNEDNNCASAYLEVKASNQPPVNPILTPDKSSPQPAGTTIKWTASATDPDGDTLLYRFWIKGPSTGNSWTVKRDWSTVNTWTWYTTYSDVGDTDLSVWIRDGHHEPPDKYDLEKVCYDYNIKAGNQPPVNPTLTPDKAEPQTAGTSITWTASATDPEGDTLSYRFWIRGPSTGDSWSMKRDWSTDNTWKWHTSTADIGDTDISVWIRDGHHAPPDKYDSERIVYDYEITADKKRPTATIDSITPNPATQGDDTVRFKGHGSDSDGYIVDYYWESSKDGFLGSSNEFTRSASNLAVSIHTIYFKVKDDDGQWSDWATMTLTIKKSITGKPDLIVSSIKFKPNPASAGDDVVVSVTVKNQGKGDAGAHDEFLGQPYATIIHKEWHCSGLKAGASKTFTHTLKNVQESVTYEACADWGGVVEESDEDNNCRTAYLEVKEQSKYAKFRGVVTGTSPEGLIGAIYWYVNVDEWLSGSLSCDEIDVVIGMYPPFGSWDENICKGDRVEAYGEVNPWGEGKCTVGLNGESYYIKKI